MIKISQSFSWNHIQAIPSWCWCAAAVIGLVGASLYLLYKGVKYIIDEGHRDDNIKWCREQMSKCTDNERYNALLEMLKVLQSS